MQNLDYFRKVEIKKQQRKIYQQKSRNQKTEKENQGF